MASPNKRTVFTRFGAEIGVMVQFKKLERRRALSQNGLSPD